MQSIIITGGAGFIGSHVVRLFVNKYPDYRIINVDKLTYAGNLANLKDIEDRPNYRFVRADICDFQTIYQVMQEEQVTGVIHLAAESHVDRSIKDPFTFAQTNVMGTLSMLQAAKALLGVAAGTLRGEALLPYLDRRGIWCAGDDPPRGYRTAVYHQGFVRRAPPGVW